MHSATGRTVSSWSNTNELAKIGWSGIYFEPHIDHYNDLAANHGDNPRIQTVQKAISNFTGESKLYLGGSVSTIRRDVKELYLDLPEFRSTGLGHGSVLPVAVDTLDNELLRLNTPDTFDLLVVDVEGSEMDVLDEFDIDFYAPTMAIIETHEKYHDERLSAKSVDIDEYMDVAGYQKIYSDRINSVYIREI
jgi:FkbM family methyltransferase